MLTLLKRQARQRQSAALERAELLGRRTAAADARVQRADCRRRRTAGRAHGPRGSADALQAKRPQAAAAAGEAAES